MLSDSRFILWSTASHPPLLFVSKQVEILFIPVDAFRCMFVFKIFLADSICFLEKLSPKLYTNQLLTFKNCYIVAYATPVELIVPISDHACMQLTSMRNIMFMVLLCISTDLHHINNMLGSENGSLNIIVKFWHFIFNIARLGFCISARH